MMGAFLRGYRTTITTQFGKHDNNDGPSRLAAQIAFQIERRLLKSQQTQRLHFPFD
jgi:hypothetical protein